MDGDLRPRMRLLDWRPLRKNTLRGFATLELPKALTIRDVSVHEKNGKMLAGLPAKPQIDGEGRVIRAAGGKIIQYAAILTWRDRDLPDRFSDAVVALIRAEHPEIEEAR
jgi:hypothetical protein